MSPYLRSLLGVAAAWFVGGAVAVLAVPGINVWDLKVWQAALAGGILGVVKGLAARKVGDPATANLFR